MKQHRLGLVALSVLLVSAYAPAFGQITDLPVTPSFGIPAAPTGSDTKVIFAPQSSIPVPGDTGLRAHTNHLIYTTAATASRLEPGMTIIPTTPLAAQGLGATPARGSGPGGSMSPANVRSFYSVPSTGGSDVIAIVGAYHYPNALRDFNYFSKIFSTPSNNLKTETSTNATAATNKVFQVVYASGKQPATDVGWAQEAALDIEWAHAMAPNAKIVLVEAASNSFANLFAAITKAASLPGVRQVSMSWGGDEFSSETYYDSYFLDSKKQPLKVVFFSSSGDVGGVISYPSVSPYVVAVGGTSVATDLSGNLTGETGWSGSGGGNSLYEAKPSFQLNLTPSTKRGVPDISAIADPNTGVAVYAPSSATTSGWYIFGGTSVACPVVAGITNCLGSTSSDSVTELKKIYSNIGKPQVRDILSGTAGTFRCTTGWDYVTGVGSPFGTGSL